MALSRKKLLKTVAEKKALIAHKMLVKLTTDGTTYDLFTSNRVQDHHQQNLPKYLSAFLRESSDGHPSLM